MLSSLLLFAALQLPTPDYPSRVEIRRTAHGVPHILAEDMAAMGYGLAWAQLEDHGAMVVLNLVRGRGELSKIFGADSLESDFTHKETHALAVARAVSFARSTSRLVRRTRRMLRRSSH
ncbi:MAG: penicillin acylase family protein [Gemmatimonadota bacterium]